MNEDYPERTKSLKESRPKMDREKWLAIRNTPRKPKSEVKYVHTATDFRWVDPNLGQDTKGLKTSKFVKASKGKSFHRTQSKG